MINHVADDVENFAMQVRSYLWIAQGVAGALTGAAATILALWLIFTHRQETSALVATSVALLGSAFVVYYFVSRIKSLWTLERKREGIELFLQNEYNPAIIVWCVALASFGYGIAQSIGK